MNSAYRMFMLYLDLDELDEAFRGSRLFSARRRARWPNFEGQTILVIRTYP